MASVFTIEYQNIISIENLLLAWSEFVRGKRGRCDVREFHAHLIDHIFVLHRDLKDKLYQHGPYEAFRICDPKPRHIHKAVVRDRIVHHALYRVLYPLFDPTLIKDSYSCRKDKGTHKALNQFQAFSYRASCNNTRTCWVLKCDIRQFFASISHEKLFNILDRRISDMDVLWLLRRVVESFHAGTPGVGLPLGNLTSQLLVNVYMNEFDQFAKHRLKAKHYIRYADDFIVLHQDQGVLLEMCAKMGDFLQEELCLDLHPRKVSVTTLARGVDFLGWVHWIDHRVLRSATRHRMMRRLSEATSNATKASYQGMLSHGNARKLSRRVFM